MPELTNIPQEWVDRYIVETIAYDLENFLLKKNRPLRKKLEKLINESIGKIGKVKKNCPNFLEQVDYFYYFQLLFSETKC